MADGAHGVKQRPLRLLQLSGTGVCFIVGIAFALPLFYNFSADRRRSRLHIMSTLDKVAYQGAEWSRVIRQLKVESLHCIRTHTLGETELAASKEAKIVALGVYCCIWSAIRNAGGP